MTAASGDPGEKPDSGGLMPPIGGSAQTPTPGGREAPPIDRCPPMAATPPPPPPGYGGDLSPGAAGYGTPGAFRRRPPADSRHPARRRAISRVIRPPPPGYQPQFGQPTRRRHPGIRLRRRSTGLLPGRVRRTDRGDRNQLAGDLLAGRLGGRSALRYRFGDRHRLGRGRTEPDQTHPAGRFGLAVAGIVVGVASLIISLVFMIYALN